MASESWILEQAKEELQILEAQHPDRFDYLKLELKSFISELTAANFSSSTSHSPLFQQYLPASSTALSTSAATTQVSSNRKKRKVKGRLVRDSETKRRTTLGLDSSNAVNNSRVDVVVERAEACLRKIREMKESFHEW